MSPAEAAIVNVLFLTVLAVASYTDATRGKIYNLLTFPAMALGFLLNLVFWGVQTPLAGLRFAGLGFAVGLALLIVPFALGGTKAGDVKLLAAVGALKGWEFVFVGFLYGAVVFLPVALVLLARSGKLRRALQNIREYFYGLVVLQTKPELAPPATRVAYPYGISLAIGFVVALVLEYALGRPGFWRW